jgi:hypothetical protein
LNALFAWWGVPAGNANGAFDAQMKRFKELMSGLQAVQSGAYARQMAALLDTSQRVSAALQAFPHCRKPDDVVAAGSTVVATILEGAMLQADTWIDFTQKLQDCYAALTLAPVAEDRASTSERAHWVEPVKTDGKATRPLKVEVPSKRNVEGSTSPLTAEVA